MQQAPEIPSVPSLGFTRHACSCYLLQPPRNTFDIWVHPDAPGDVFVDVYGYLHMLYSYSKGLASARKHILCKTVMDYADGQQHAHWAFHAFSDAKCKDVH